jgi:hypothetical protein
MTLKIVVGSAATNFILLTPEMLYITGDFFYVGQTAKIEITFLPQTQARFHPWITRNLFPKLPESIDCLKSHEDALQLMATRFLPNRFMVSSAFGPNPAVQSVVNWSKQLETPS